MKKIDIAFIGGSGLYKVPNLKKITWKSTKPKFGTPSSDICVGELNQKRVAFLPRHGLNHNISPSFINYRANIEALKILGVECIISISAVGSLREDFKPGDFVLVDQFIDKTHAREKSFFDNDLVIHVPMSSPVCIKLKEKSASTLKKLKIKFHSSGTYICIEGPQFSTLAESNLYRSWGCDVIGMTNMPEAKLAREAGICYSTISMVTDFDCWHPKHDSVTIDQIVQTLNDNSTKAFNFIDEFCKSFDYSCEEKIKNIAKNSAITNFSKVKIKTKNKLQNIIKIP
ncbi:MAG: S-methyl-5'-thioadenosine phosphorylase [Rickettsiales bacterium]|nr:S-methyl-5'-thioadenosine phosphorylase [Rickettsiales bacterium]